MNTSEFFEEFTDLPGEVKRQILQEQIDSYLAQAFAWKIKAAVLRKQKGYLAKKALREREIDAALGNARLNLESMQIIIDLVEELLPLQESNATDSPTLTLDTFDEMVSLEDMEAAAYEENAKRALEATSLDGKV